MAVILRSKLEALPYYIKSRPPVMAIDNLRGCVLILGSRYSVKLFYNLLWLLMLNPLCTFLFLLLSESVVGGFLTITASLILPAIAVSNPRLKQAFKNDLSLYKSSASVSALCFLIVSVMEVVLKIRFILLIA